MSKAGISFVRFDFIYVSSYYSSYYNCYLRFYSEAQALLFSGYQISCVSDWLSEWVNEYAIFLRGLAQQWRSQKKQNLAHR